MQERWIADRAMLQQLIQKHPEWTQQELADWIGRSLGWVKKWVKRLREAPEGGCKGSVRQAIWTQNPLSANRSRGGRTHSVHSGCSARESQADSRATSDLVLLAS